MKLTIFNEENKSIQQQQKEFADLLENFYLVKIPDLGEVAGIGDALDSVVHTVESFLGNSNETAVGWHTPYVLGERDFISEDFWKSSIIKHSLVAALCSVESLLLGDQVINTRDLGMYFTMGPLSAKKEGHITENWRVKERHSTSGANESDGSEMGHWASALLRRLSAEEQEAFCTGAYAGNDMNYRNDIKLENYDVFSKLVKLREKTGVLEELLSKKENCDQKRSGKGEKKYQQRTKMVDFFGKKIHKAYSFEEGDRYPLSLGDYCKLFEKAKECAFPDIPREKAGNEEKCDYLITVYKLERFYNFSFNESVLQDMIRVREKYTSFFQRDQSRLLQLLFYMSQMPNTFSRNEMCRIVFAQLDERMGEIDRTMAIPIAIREEEEAWESWLHDATEFLHNIISVVIPLAERTLMTVLTRKYSLSEDGDRKKLIRCLEDLVEYIGHEYISIIEPSLTEIQHSAVKETQLSGHILYKDMQDNPNCVKKIEEESIYIKKRVYQGYYDRIVVEDYTDAYWKFDDNACWRYIYPYGIEGDTIFQNSQLLTDARIKNAKTILEWQIDQKKKGVKKDAFCIVQVERPEKLYSRLKGRQINLNRLFYNLLKGQSNLLHQYSSGYDIFSRDWLMSEQELQKRIRTESIERNRKQWDEQRLTEAKKTRETFLKEVIVPARYDE